MTCDADVLEDHPLMCLHMLGRFSAPGQSSMFWQQHIKQGNCCILPITCYIQTLSAPTTPPPPSPPHLLLPCPSAFPPLLQLIKARMTINRYLTSSSFSVLCTLNDTRQVQHLDLGTPVVHHSRNACQGCELVGSYLHNAPQFSEVLVPLIVL